MADADLDAEWWHDVVRWHGLRTSIPPRRGRPWDRPPAGRWRRVRRRRFARFESEYGQRWRGDPGNARIQRRRGPGLRARVEANQFREISPRAITYNGYQRKGSPLRSTCCPGGGTIRPLREMRSSQTSAEGRMTCRSRRRVRRSDLEPSRSNQEVSRGVGRRMVLSLLHPSGLIAITKAMRPASLLRIRSTLSGVIAIFEFPRRRCAG